MSQIIRKGVKSVSKSGSSELTGDVTLSEGAGVTLTQSGQDIEIAASGGGSGTVTSVAQTVPTGFTVSGSPVTTTGTLAIAYDTGYQGYTTTEANKLSNIEASADVTDTTNVTAAGALMDSEVTNLAQVKAFDSADYATAAQGALADSATQPGDLATVATTGAYADLSGTPTIPTVSDTAYDATSWNGNTDAPTKNAVRDKIESMGSGSGDVVGPASSTDNALARYDGTTGKILQDAPYSTIDDTGKLRLTNAYGTLFTIDDGQVTASGGTDLGLASVNGVRIDATGSSSGVQISNDDLKTNAIAERSAGSGVTIDGLLIKDGEVDGVDVSTTYRTGGTDVALADGGTGASLTDPNADRIMFWDDSAGAVTWLTASTGLTLSGTNLTARTSSTTQTGIVELATTAETQTGTDATRAVTPDGLNDMTTLAGKAWFLDEDNMASNDATKVASQQSIKAYVDSAITAAKAAMLPVGSIYVNRTNSANPSTYLGFGTWVAIEDKMIMARGSTYTADGGSSTHSHALSDAAHAQAEWDGSLNAFIGREITVPSYSLNRRTSGTTTSTTGTSTGGIPLSGSTDSGSTIPPMIVAYVWERTA